VVPPLCPVRVSPVDFSRSAELIDRSLNSTRHWLPTDRTGTRQSEVLEFHRD
jgi:NTE family protein